MKRTWFQAQIKQDITISTQFEHERHSTHKRGSYNIFTKRKPSTSIYPKATKSITIHLMSITSKVITSYLAYHGDQSIWEKHISREYDTNAVCDTKMQTWYENATCICTWDAQPKLKRANKHKTHTLPLSTCTRAKKHTKLTLSARARARSKKHTKHTGSP
jgi:hypothetical protein